MDKIKRGRGLTGLEQHTIRLTNRRLAIPYNLFPTTTLSAKRLEISKPQPNKFLLRFYGVNLFRLNLSIFPFDFNTTSLYFFTFV